MLYLSLRQYEYVVAVAKAGSLTRAAVAVGVSQPSLSVALTRVEERLGQAVFLRGKGAAISLTPFGHRFVAQAQALLDDAAALERLADRARPFILGCFEDIAPWYLPRALGCLRRQFDGVDFQGREGRFSSLADDMLQGRMDLAISYDVGLKGQFDRLKLAQVRPVAFVAPDHPLARYAALDLHQLKDCALILSAEELSLGYVRQLFQRLGLQPEIAHRTASLEMMRALAAHGEGVGLSYSHPPGGQSYDGAPLLTIPITTPEAQADIVLVWPTGDAPDARLGQIVTALSAML